MKNEPLPQLHIPEPLHRPGDRPDFGYLNIPEPADTACPDPLVRPSEIRDLAFSLIRVLTRMALLRGRGIRNSCPSCCAGHSPRFC